MPFTFTKQLPTNDLVYAYNNNRVEFTTDNIANAYKCDIQIDGVSVAEITPFNSQFVVTSWEGIFKSLYTHQFKDNIVPEISGTIASAIYPYTDPLRSIEVAYVVHYNDTTTETERINVEVLMGVVDFRQSKRQELLDSTEFCFLHPPKSRTDRKHRLTYFLGYPFEIAMYSKVAGVYPLTNNNTNLTLDLPLSAGVNRLFISDGDNDVTTISLWPITKGVNTLIVKTQDDIPEIELNTVEKPCGVYLKWLNQYGVWEYWLFDLPEQENINIGRLGRIDNDFADLTNSEPFMQIGKSVQPTINCIADYVSNEDRARIASLQASPRVYYYEGIRYSYSKDPWLVCSVSTTRMVSKKPIDRLEQIELTIALPERKALTL